MHVARLSLTDFRSYADVQVELQPGVCTFVGPNGQGKTNLVEAIGYLATAASHRVATDAPLVRDGATSAVLRAEVVRAGRSLLLELELNPGRSNRARVNRSPLPRARELLGLLRTVLFAPEDLALVKGEPDQRRRFLDELLVVRTPRLAGVRADYERVVRQRNALLKSAAAARRSGDLSTLDVWDAHLAQRGAELVAARLELVAGLSPLVAASYGCLAPGAAASVAYRSVLPDDVLRSADRQELASALAETLAEVRPKELERGVSLVGPHRDDLALGLGGLPAKGYASHGESWSFALALRLASFDLLAADGDDPVLVLDDVFAELDERRRSHLAERVLAAEQVLVTAAVPGDVPGALDGVRYDVRSGEVRRA